MVPASDSQPAKPVLSTQPVRHTFIPAQRGPVSPQCVCDCDWLNGRRRFVESNASPFNLPPRRLLVCWKNYGCDPPPKKSRRKALTAAKRAGTDVGKKVESQTLLAELSEANTDCVLECLEMHRQTFGQLATGSANQRTGQQ